MLVFLTTQAHRYTVRELLCRSYVPICGRTVTMSYDEFLCWRRLPVGNYIFADVDRLSQADRVRVAARLNALRDTVPGLRVLNDPILSLDRRQLLMALHLEGLNDFQAIPASGDFSALRFPVFVRRAVDHTGSLTRLLANAEELTTALAALSEAGHKLEDCLIVEFIDVRNDDGLFEKYSVLRVGDRFIAADRSVHTDWVCKNEADEFCNDEWLARDREFSVRNPHIERLRPLFERAGIDYGRIDYAFARGRLQTFEINSNPMMASPRDAEPAFRPSMERYIAAFVEAMLEFDGDSPFHGGSIAVPGATGIDQVDGLRLRQRSLRQLLRRIGLLRLEHKVVRELRRLRRLFTHWNRPSPPRR